MIMDRLGRYDVVSRALAAISSAELRLLLDDAPVVSEGIGGRAVVVTIEGTLVFVKQVPLTDLERRPENIGSTANLFRLPVFYQYGVGSAGFGVWRELAALSTVSDWVRQGAATSFPLLYGSRVLPGSAPPTTQAEIERTVDFWASSPAVRTRLTELSTATAVVALFMEHFPRTLRSYTGAAKKQLPSLLDESLHSGRRQSLSTRYPSGSPVASLPGEHSQCLAIGRLRVTIYSPGSIHPSLLPRFRLR